MSYIIVFILIKGSDSVTTPIYLTFFTFKIFNFAILTVALLKIQIIWFECCIIRRVVPLNVKALHFFEIQFTTYLATQ